MLEIIDLNQEIFTGMPEVKISVHASHEEWDGIPDSDVVSPALKVDRPKVTFRQFSRAFFNTGRQLVIMFFGFASIGYLLNGLIPAEWIQALFGSGQAYSVPLAATFGLPFYINTESSLPLARDHHRHRYAVGGRDPDRRTV